MECRTEGDHEREVEKVESITGPNTYIMSSRKISTREKEKEERRRCFPKNKARKFSRPDGRHESPANKKKSALRYMAVKLQNHWQREALKSSKRDYLLQKLRGGSNFY